MTIKNLDNEETAYFCEQMAMILEAGISVADGLEILRDDADDDRAKGIFGNVAEKMADDTALFTAMDESGLFPPYAVNMVKTGFLAGRPEEALRELADYYSDKAELRKTIQSSVSHPMLLLAMMTAVIIVMVVNVIPMFRDIFARFDKTAAAAAADSVAFAYGLGTVIMIVLICILAIVIITALLMKIPAARKKLGSIFDNFVLTRNMSEIIALADITGAMSMMTACGASPEQTLEMAAQLTNNKSVISKIKECDRLITEENSFPEAIGKSGLLPAVCASTLKMAYKSGTFENAWKKISERINNERDRRIYRTVSFIEPAIVGILAIITGAVLLTVMLPMANIITAIG